MKFATFAQVEQGALAERPIGIPCIGRDGKPIELKSLVVPLVGEEDSTAIAFGRKHAVRGGVADPTPLDPLFDLGHQAAIVALAFKDPDSGEAGKREPTFASADEVLGGLTRETITFLFSQFQAWADECSPTRRSMSVAEILAGIRLIAEEGDDGQRFFAACGPSMRWSLVHSMAKQLVSLLETKSPSGSSSPTTDTTPTSPSSSA